MSEPKTALDLERLMHEAAMNRNRAMNTDEETAEFERIRAEMAARLDAIPANSPEQIADLTARLAAAMGALEQAHKYLRCNGDGENAGPCPGCHASRLVSNTLADEPPESKRLRAIEEAAEAETEAEDVVKSAFAEMDRLRPQSLGEDRRAHDKAFQEYTVASNARHAAALARRKAVRGEVTDARQIVAQDTA